ncbi:MAG: hypothetical protein KDE15_12055 [Erythrobacter sp.]|nr:hypothetical protein [Erythrobacter sp.]
MTKGLALTVAIAILALVSNLAGEGGPLDNFSQTSRVASRPADVAGTEVAQPESEVLAANVEADAPTSRAATPAPVIEEWSGFETRNEVQRSPRVSESSGSGRVYRPRIGNNGSIGAVDSARLNIEQ